MLRLDRAILGVIIIVFIMASCAEAEQISRMNACRAYRLSGESRHHVLAKSGFVFLTSPAFVRSRLLHPLSGGLLCSKRFSR
jgi:hypothetical protein